MLGWRVGVVFLSGMIGIQASEQDSSPDLENWSVHSSQEKSLEAGQLRFEVDFSSVAPPQFFQVFGPEL